MRMPLFLFAFLALALAGCGGSKNTTVSDDGDAPRSIRTGSSETVTLMEGEQASFESRGALYTVTFQRRISDGRCPQNANCVQLGEAQVLLRILNDNRPSEHVVRVPGLVFADSREGSHSWIETRGIRLTPLELSPYPGAGNDAATPQLMLRMEPSAGA